MICTSLSRRVYAAAVAALVSASTLFAQSPVGSLPGEVFVDNGGRANYSIPITLPPGTGGMAPTLSLNYNSSTPNGPLGVGWSLGGLSSISRVSSSFFYDDVSSGVMFKPETDRLALDGQRLVFTAGSSYWATGATYRTAQETFNKVTATGSFGNGPSGFILNSKAGLTSYYGEVDGLSSNATVRLWSDADNDGVGVPFDPNETQVHTWLVSKIGDTLGNYMTFHYVTYNNVAYISRIEYTGNTEQGLSPYNQIRFIYATRSGPEVASTYLAGNEIKQDRRLSEIQVWIDAPSGSDTGGTLAYKYTLNYRPTSPQGNNSLTGRSTLQSIQFTSVKDGQNYTLNATQFGWSDRSGTLSQQYSAAIDTGVSMNSAEDRCFFADMDGDGKQELIIVDKWTVGDSEPISVNCYRLNPNGTYQKISSPRLPRDCADAVSTVGDIDDDGIDELVVCLNFRYFYVYELQGDSLVLTKEHYAYLGVSSKDEINMGCADLDYDGHTEVAIIYGYPTENVKFFILDNVGSNDFTWRSAHAEFDVDIDVPDVRQDDINGDGIFDLIVFRNQQEGSSRVRIGSVATTSVNGRPQREFNSFTGDDKHMIALTGSLSTDLPKGRYLTADFNQDGFTDFAVIQKQDLAEDKFMVRRYLNTQRIRKSGVNTFYLFEPAGVCYTNVTWNDDYSASLDDVSGDGKPDLCLAVKNSSGDIVVRVFKANGSYAGFDTGSLYYSASTYKNWDDTHSSLVSTDYDGDGVTDLVLFHNDYSGSRPSWIAYHGLGVPGDLMTSVTNGYGDASSITYSTLIDNSVYWIGDRSSFPVVTKTVPMTVVKTVSHPDGVGGIYKSEYAYSDARFHLQGLGFLGFESMVVYDPQARVYEWKHLEHFYPLMGMMARGEKWYVPESAAAPSNSDPVSSTHWLLSRISNTNIYDKVAGGTLFSMTVQSVDEKWQIDNALDGSGAINRPSDTPYISTTSKSWFDGQSQSSIATLPVVSISGPLHADYVSACPGDITYGNIEKTVVSHSANGETFTDTTENDYASVDTATWLLGRLLYSKTTATSTAGSEVRTAAFLYKDSTGLIAAEVEEPSQSGVNDLLDPNTPFPSDPEEATQPHYALLLGEGHESKLTIYNRDGFGNILTEQVQFRDINVAALTDPTVSIPVSDPTVLNIKTNIFHSDDKGRYARQVKNIDGDIETFSYDPKTGAVLTQSGPNGKTTTFQYDAFGRVTREDRPDGTWTTVTREWHSSALPSHDMGSQVSHKVTTQATASPTSVVYYDKKQRELRSSAEGAATNSWIYKDSVYNAKGQVVKASDNYFASSTPIWTTTNYDKLGRLQITTAPDLTKSFTLYRGTEQTVISNYVDGNFSAGEPQVDQRSTTLSDARGSPRLVTNTLGKQLTHTYSPAGRLVSSSTTGSHASGSNKTHTVQLTYDDRGNKKKMRDPDMCLSTDPNSGWFYATNALGQLRWQKDAKGQVTKLHYDNLGRLIRRENAEGTAEWSYYKKEDRGGEGAWVGALRYERFHRTGDPAGTYFTQKSFYYDALGRSYLTLTGVDGHWSYSYSRFDDIGRLHRVDHFWRPKGITDPTSKIWHSFGTHYTYTTDKSFVTEVSDSTGKTWWSADPGDYDAFGRVTKYEYGNGTETNLTYETNRPTILTDILVTLPNALDPPNPTEISSYQVTADKLGNITSREDLKRGKTEDFTYDGLNRLRTSEITLGNNANRGLESYDFDDFGNFSTRTGVGTYAYNTSRTHAVTSAGTHSYTYDPNGNALSRDGTSLAWNSANLPTLLGKGDQWSYFAYDAAQNRVIQVSRENELTDNVTKKLYLGAIEQEWTADVSAPDYNPGLQNEWQNWTYTLKHTRVYISTPSGVIGSLTHNPDGTNPIEALDRNYFHYDHLGSIAEVTNDAGAIVESLSYDVWGQRRHADTWVPFGDPADHVDFATTGEETGTDRGFTGHEMLDHLGLVHMNARIYDPIIGRFISPDSVLQFPNNIQSYDRYQYVLNNPCTFTDPSGHFLPLLVGIMLTASGFAAAHFIPTVIIMAITSAAWAAINGAEGADIWKAGAMAAAMAIVSCGIGKLFGDIGDPSSGMVDLGNTGTQEIARAAAHGVSGGVAEQINGGSFGTGFAASFVGSAAGSAMGTGPAAKFFEGQDTAAVFKRTVAVAIIGGTTAEIGGGKFANGAMTAAIQHLFSEGATSQERSTALQKIRAATEAGTITHIDPAGGDIQHFEAAMVDLAVGGGETGQELFSQTIRDGLVVHWTKGGSPSSPADGVVLVSGSSDFLSGESRAELASHGELPSSHAGAIILGHELSHALWNTRDPWSIFDLSVWYRGTLKDAAEAKAHAMEMSGGIDLGGLRFATPGCTSYGKTNSVFIENQLRNAFSVEERMTYHGLPRSL